MHVRQAAISQVLNRGNRIVPADGEIVASQAVALSGLAIRSRRPAINSGEHMQRGAQRSLAVDCLSYSHCIAAHEVVSCQLRNRFRSRKPMISVIACDDDRRVASIPNWVFTTILGAR